jgi:membrane peptidoglycan carboxypeptidase
MVRTGIAIAVGLPLVGLLLAISFFFVAVTVFVPKADVPLPGLGARAETTLVYAADGSVIATLHAEHNREIIKLSAMPKHLQDAVVAAEDDSLYSHNGGKTGTASDYQNAWFVGYTPDCRRRYGWATSSGTGPSSTSKACAA